MLSRWYRTGVIYPLDIGLFQDANGDGIGDIQGLISWLDYLARLPVTTIWLNPIHRRRGGYDITEYFGVHPRFGSLGDFAILMHEAGERGIRVMLDLVVNHTSDAHRGFRRALESALAVPGLVRMVAGRTSRSLRGNDVPGVENETWTYEQAHAWYRHRFYRFEPDLNTDNPAVREEIRKKVALFWVGLGVTGFRIDKVLSQAGDVLTGPHGEASEENPGNVGPRPRVSRAAGRPGLPLHELPDLLMWPRGRGASLAL